MKNKLFYYVVAALFFAAFTFGIISCNKDDDNNNEPDAPTYTDGTGEIGKKGGTVKIEDEDSPINGTSVKIPDGALDEPVEISIEEANDIEIEGHSEVKEVKFLPEGTEFSKEVEITLPWSS